MNAKVEAKRTRKELIALAKARPGSIAMAPMASAPMRLQHGGLQAAHRRRHRPYPLSRRDAGRAGAARRRRLHAATQPLQHRGAREDRQGAHLGRRRRQARAGAARPADHRGGGRAGLRHHGVVRPARARQHAGGARQQDPRRRQQGAGPAADQGVLREEQLRAGDAVARPIRQADRRRFAALGEADQPGLGARVD